MATGSPGTGLTSWRPSAPDRGSFPLDHDNECSHIMKEYIQCLRLVRGDNAPGCRLLAKSYLKCRMDNGLMDKDEWANLGLPEDETSNVFRKSTVKEKDKPPEKS